jgi:hypothetical protein
MLSTINNGVKPSLKSFCKLPGPYIGWTLLTRYKTVILLPCAVWMWVHTENAFTFLSRTVLQGFWIIYFLLSFRSSFFPSLLLFLLWRLPSFFLTSRTEILQMKAHLFAKNSSVPLWRIEWSGSILVSQTRLDLCEHGSLSVTVTTTLPRQADLFVVSQMKPLRLLVY